MDIDSIKHAIEQHKSGQLNESSTPDNMVFSDLNYDVNESYFMIHESLSLDGKRKFFINNNFIQNNTYNQLDEFVERENGIFQQLFAMYQDTNTIKSSNLITPFSNMFAYMNHHKPVSEITESLQAYINSGDYQVFENKEKRSEIVSTIAKKINFFKTFKSIPNNEMTYLDEGMIKVPPKTLSYINQIIDVLIYQISINNVADKSSFDMMKEFISRIDLNVQSIKELSDDVMGKHIVYDSNVGFSGHLNIRMDRNDIPYKIDQDFIPLTVVLSNSIDDEGISDELNGQPIITINTNKIKKLFDEYNIIDNPLLFVDKNFIRKVVDIKDMLMSTVIHELMHVMQHTVFAQNEYRSGNNNPKSIEKGDDDYDSYISAQVEFDPTINDLVHSFNRNIDGLEEYLDEKFTNEIKLELLKKFLGSHYEDNSIPSYFNTKHESVKAVINQVFQPPRMVVVIKNQKPDKYPVLVRKMYSEIAV